jgi:hypothetical protein
MAVPRLPTAVLSPSTLLCTCREGEDKGEKGGGGRGGSEERRERGRGKEGGREREDQQITMVQS